MWLSVDRIDSASRFMFIGVSFHCARGVLYLFPFGFGVCGGRVALNVLTLSVDDSDSFFCDGDMNS